MEPENVYPWEDWKEAMQDATSDWEQQFAGVPVKSVVQEPKP